MTIVVTYISIYSFSGEECVDHAVRLIPKMSGKKDDCQTEIRYFYEFLFLRADINSKTNVVGDVRNYHHY